MSDEENMTEEEMAQLWAEAGQPLPDEEAEEQQFGGEDIAAAVVAEAEAIEETLVEPRAAVEVSEPVVETASKVPPAEAKLSSDDISAKMEALKAQREAATKNLGFGDDPEAGVNLKKPDTTTKLVAADLDEKRGEVTASTLGKLMGLATSNEMRLMEGKVDLLSTRVNAMIMKLEKMALLIQDTPSSSDLDRIDVQLASLRTLIKDVVDGSLQKALEAERQKAQQRLDEQAKEVKKTGSSIVSNNPNSPSQ